MPLTQLEIMSKLRRKLQKISFYRKQLFTAVKYNMIFAWFLLVKALLEMLSNYQQDQDLNLQVPWSCYWALYNLFILCIGCICFCYKAKLMLNFLIDKLFLSMHLTVLVIALRHQNTTNAVFCFISFNVQPRDVRRWSEIPEIALVVLYYALQIQLYYFGIRYMKAIEIEPRAARLLKQRMQLTWNPKNYIG